ncbi:hypothetical protein [Candidatus Poriferisocius sp.]|uniref:hypothetical protein n=1 Tax=Candidatus Poriferisocius sp. TaxID=3101276 RepID=UPI003B012A6D
MTDSYTIDASTPGCSYFDHSGYSQQHRDALQAVAQRAQPEDGFIERVFTIDG